MGDHEPYATLDEPETDAEHRQSMERLAQERQDDAFVWLMSGPKGRRFILGLLGRTGVFGPAFSTNAMQMAHREGQKSVGYWVLEEIKRLCPEHYKNLMEETQNV